MYSRVLFCACSVMILVVAYSLNCPTECSQAVCQPLTRLRCPHGVVLDPSCSCCYICGKGLGELCGGEDDLFGACGNGLECKVSPPPGVPTDLPSAITFPGRCVAPEVPSCSPTPTHTTPPNSATTSPTATSLQIEPSSSVPNPTATTSPVVCETPSSSPLNCSPKCDLGFCLGSKNKVCSAQAGLAFTRVRERNACQHTTCKACFYLVDPNCLRPCPEPPGRGCLRKFSNCIRDYFNNSTPTLLELNNPRVLMVPGRVICYVPEVFVAAAQQGTNSPGAATPH